MLDSVPHTPRDDSFGRRYSSEPLMVPTRTVEEIASEASRRIAVLRRSEDLTRALKETGLLEMYLQVGSNSTPAQQQS